MIRIFLDIALKIDLTLENPNFLNLYNPLILK